MTKKLLSILAFLCLTVASAWAQTNHTVTLKAGEGSGADIIISSAVAANVATNQSSASNGQFWWEEDKLLFKFPNCPASFSSPDGKLFYGWNAQKFSPGTVFQVTSDMELTAQWIDPNYFTFENLRYRVTSESPAEVVLYGKEEVDISDLVIPGTVQNPFNHNNYTVTAIGDNVFKECYGLTSVTIPASVTSIGNYAFMNCSSLTTVNLASGSQLTTIGQGAFYRCIGLTSATIPASVTSIGESAFSYCTGLTSVTIPSSVTTIGGDAFRGCTGLTSVTIPASVTTIEVYAFMGCTSLTSVTIPSSVTSIGWWAFYDCTNLTSVTLNSNPYINTSFPENATVTMNLTANKVASEDYWMTFYNDAYNFQADENTTVYKAKINGSSLALTPVTDRIVTAGKAVILKSSSEHPVMTRVSSGSSDNYSNNDLQGVMEETNKPENCYTLANGSAGVGFYKYSGEKLGAGKAYLIYTGSGAARTFYGFSDGDATAIEAPEVVSDSDDGDIYDLMGRKMQGQPIKKGIYVKQGKKYIVK